MAAPMLLDWTKLWPLVLTSSVIAAFLTYGLGLLKDWFNRSRDADFAALYVALTLEDYPPPFQYDFTRRGHIGRGECEFSSVWISRTC